MVLTEGNRNDPLALLCLQSYASCLAFLDTFNGISSGPAIIGGARLQLCGLRHGHFLVFHHFSPKLSHNLLQDLYHLKTLPSTKFKSGGPHHKQKAGEACVTS